MLPETNFFQVLKAERETKSAQRAEETGIAKGSAVKAFFKEAGTALRANWFLFIYMYAA